ncbi:hypothetical protein [Paenibacillus taihuensis]|nr:hypothetical protein [Paenibacillus taihuensis]
MLTALLAAETLPAASFALTVNVYAVLALSPLTVNEVPGVEPARVEPL